MDDIHSTYRIILVIHVVNSRVSSIFSTLPSLGASHADRDFAGHLGVDDTYIREGYCSPSVYPPTLMLQFGSISGHQPPTNSMGRDIELLKLNPALDLEPLAIHSKVSPSDGVTVRPHSRLNFTIIKKRRVKHKVDCIWGLLLQVSL